MGVHALFTPFSLVRLTTLRLSCKPASRASGTAARLLPFLGCQTAYAPSARGAIAVAGLDSRRGFSPEPPYAGLPASGASWAAHKGALQSCNALAYYLYEGKQNRFLAMTLLLQRGSGGRHARTLNAHRPAQLERTNENACAAEVIVPAR